MSIIKCSNRPTVWTPEMEAKLRGMYGKYSTSRIAKELGLTLCRVQGGFKKFGLEPYRDPSSIFLKRHPPATLWVEVATEVAKKSRIKPSYLMAGDKHKPVVRARQEAWATFLKRHPQYSIAGVAQVSGFHHTCVIFGIRAYKAREMEAA